MEALGQLTGGLAHDFNDPLAVIIGNLDLLIQAGAIDAEKDELVREALDAALNGGELTRRLSAFARRAALTELESRGRVDLVLPTWSCQAIWMGARSHAKWRRGILISISFSRRAFQALRCQEPTSLGQAFVC